MGIAWNSDLKGAAHLMTMIIPIEQEVRGNTKEKRPGRYSPTNFVS